jgi:hypothetical protein
MTMMIKPYYEHKTELSRGISRREKEEGPGGR